MPTNPPSNSPAGDGDPSMDDILASIRRILSDEEKTAKAAAPDDGVLMLDPSMMIDDTSLPPQGQPQAPHAMTPPDPFPPALPSPEPGNTSTHLISGQDFEPEPATPPPSPPPPAGAPAFASPSEAPGNGPTLVAPEVAGLAASSVGALMRTLVAERSAIVHRGGPSIEDLVREEIRPLLKAWLDAHLPALVERLVRTEIERVVGRIGT